MEEETTFCTTSTNNAQSLSCSSPRSFFTRRIKKQDSNKNKAQKARKIFSKLPPKANAQKKFVPKMVKRHLPKNLKRRKFMFDDLISSPVSEPYDFQSTDVTDFSPDTNELGIGINDEVSIVFSDCEGYVTSAVERLRKTRLSQKLSSLNKYIEKVSMFKSLQDDEYITSHLRDLNL